MTLTRRNYGRFHGYTIDGTKAPGVTAILKMRNNPAFEKFAIKVTANHAVNHWDELAELPGAARLDRLMGAKQAYLTAAAKRGTRLHSFAYRLNRDQEVAGEELDDDSDQAALVDSYLKFLDRTQADVVAAEMVIGNRNPLYCGTADLVCDLPALVTVSGDDLPAARWLLDLKTAGSGIFPESALQTCAYSRAEVYLKDGAEAPLSELGIQRCGAIHVRADGWDLYPLDTGDVTWETFKHLAWLYEHQEEYGTWVGAAVDPPGVPVTAQRF
jgi:hypothetical protein